MQKKTVWSVFRDFVNTKPLGSVISRVEIMQELRQKRNDTVQWQHNYG